MSCNPALAPGCPDDVGVDAMEASITPAPAIWAAPRSSAPFLRPSARWSILDRPRHSHNAGRTAAI